METVTVVCADCGLSSQAIQRTPLQAIKVQQSPCDITAYHTYNGSEIAPSKMQNNYRKLYNWVLVSQKKT